VTGVDLQSAEAVVNFVVTGTFTGDTTAITAPAIKVTSTKDNLVGTIALDNTAKTFTATVDVTAMADTGKHAIKLYFAADSKGDEITNYAGDITKKINGAYTATKQKIYGMDIDTWETTTYLKVTYTLTNLYTISAVGLALSNSKPYFNVNGTYDEHMTLGTDPVPYVAITSDQQTQATKESFKADMTIDTTARTFTASIDLSTMVESSWHDIKLYFNAAEDADGGEISYSKLTDDEKNSTVTYSATSTQNTFKFQQYADNLKISVTIADNKVTSYTNIFMAKGTDGAYLHLTGTNTHADGSFFVYANNTTLASAAVSTGGTFDAAVRVDNVFSDTITQLDIHFSYTNDAGVAINDEITNLNLTNYLDMAGVSYGGSNYVIGHDTWDDTANGGVVHYYYKVKKNQDGFSMDTAILSKDETDSANPKAMLNVRGTINVTNSITLGAVTLKLEGTDADTYSILAANITADGYLNATIDITAMTSTTAVTDTDAGALAIYNDTSKLNNFWPDWSHGNDVKSVTVGSYKYVIGAGQWGKYTLDKVAA
jgi:hypothetical protein